MVSVRSRLAVRNPILLFKIFSVLLDQECVVMTTDQTDKLVALSQSGSHKFETDVSFKTVPDEFKAALEQIITSEVYNREDFWSMSVNRSSSLT